MWSGDGASRARRGDNNLASRVSLNGDGAIGSDGADDCWRGFGSKDSSAERSMSDHSRAEYSSADGSGADGSSAEDSSAESGARGENGGGCETVCGGVRVNMIMMAIHERTTSCWHLT